MNLYFLSNGAEGGTRTHTSVRTTDFESVASANSTTSASTLSILTQKIFKSKNLKLLNIYYKFLKKKKIRP